MKPNGYRRQIRKWFHNKTRDTARVYPRSRSETGRDSSSRRSTPSDSRTVVHSGPFKTPLKRSRWDSSHADVELDARGDQNRAQDITEVRSHMASFVLDARQNHPIKQHNSSSLLRDSALQPKDFCPEHYRVKLADFGFSKLTLTQDQPLTTFCGSPAYAAPELFQAQNYQGGPVDMWALGVVLFFLLTGMLPYRGSTVGHVRRLVLENRGLQPPDWLSKGANTLYLKLTARQPSDRPSAAALLRYAQSDAQRHHSGAASENSLPQPPVDESNTELQPWMTWLSGQIFPKALPRFNKCPPVSTTNATTAATMNTNASTTTNVIVTAIENNISPSNASSTKDEEQKENSKAVDLGVTSEDKDANLPLHSSLAAVETEPSQPSFNKSNQSISGHIVASDEAEVEAARMLLELGVTREEIAAPENQVARSAITGAYRIMLHRAHRARRMSHLDPSVPATTDSPVGIPNSISTPLIHSGPSALIDHSKKRYRTMSPCRTTDRTRRRPTKTSRFCVIL
ncbi:unnamed protein product [Echinostoma caproni]|uniref:Protein kinase domain-containing protein n=1 Tax=Echinostoma caproni TaxID=27848 RepID=A0A183A6I7_9TREM|nr:unnamed protein product [Echinostoma caproni]